MIVPRRRQLDDRQIHARIPLRPRSATRPVARLGQPVVLHLAMDTPNSRSKRWMPAGVGQIPFMMVLLLAGLQRRCKEIQEAARVDGAGPWQGFWRITFPLMLPVSTTAILLRVIFKLKLADIVINVTSGGPGGATDTVSSLIYREYRDRSNVGYGSMSGHRLPRHHRRGADGDAQTLLPPGKRLTWRRWRCRQIARGPEKRARHDRGAPHRRTRALLYGADWCSGRSCRCSRSIGPSQPR